MKGKILDFYMTRAKVTGAIQWEFCSPGPRVWVVEKVDRGQMLYKETNRHSGVCPRAFLRLIVG